MLLLVGGGGRVAELQQRSGKSAGFGINFGLLLCMMGAAFLADVWERHGERVLGEFVFVAVILVFVVTIGVLGPLAHGPLRPAAGHGAAGEPQSVSWAVL